MMLIIRGCCFFKVYTSVMSFKKTLCKILNSVVQFPYIRLDNVVFRLDAHLSNHHPSGQRDLSFWTSLYVQKL